MSGSDPLGDVAERLQRLGDQFKAEGRIDDAVAAYAGALSILMQLSGERRRSLWH